MGNRGSRPISENPTSSIDGDNEQGQPNRRLPARKLTIERRSTIPIELEDPEDCTIGEAESEYFVYRDHDASSGAGAGKHPTIILPADSLHGRLVQLPKEARNIIAGGIAGIVAKSVVAPLDRIKILYQVSAAKFRLLDVPGVVRNIVREEGIAALWKGNTATMIRVFPYSGIQFMVFDRCKQHFLNQEQGADHWTRIGDGSGSDAMTQNSSRSDRKWGLTPIESLVSGMIAGTVSVICTYPLDLTRAQLAVLKKKTHHNAGFVRILGDNYARSGVSGLFRGISPTLLGILPYSGIAFALNEQGKREIQHLSGREVTTIERMQCGALSGLVAQTVTYPIEVTRRRMQTIGLVGNQGDTALTSLGCSRKRPIVASPPSMLSTITSLYAEQGVRGFLKGVSMNWMKGPVAFSISFTTFDTVQKRMESPTERAQRMPRFVASPPAIRRDG